MQVLFSLLVYLLVLENVIAFVSDSRLKANKLFMASTDISHEKIVVTGMVCLI